MRTENEIDPPVICETCNGSGAGQFGGLCEGCDGEGGFEVTVREEREADVRRLLARSDVSYAEVNDKNDLIYVEDNYGVAGGPFVSYSEALTFLVGQDEHLVGMAVCPCLKCIPGYIGPK